MGTIFKLLFHIFMIVLIAFSIIDPATSEQQKVRIIFYIDTGLGERIKISDCEVEVLAGQEVSCTIPYTSLEYHGNNTRIVFKGWYEGVTLISTHPTLNVTAKNDTIVQEYTAKYQVQYLIELDAGYKIIRDWLNRGSLVAYDIQEIWDFGEGIRKIFSRWTGDIESEKADIYIERLDRPLIAKAVWRTLYYVEIVSEYPLDIESGWFNEGETITIEPGKDVIYMNDGETKVELERFIIDFRPENYEDREIINGPVKIEVYSPIVIQAVWKKYHHVLLESNYIKPILLDNWMEHGSRLIFDKIQDEVIWPNSTKIVFDRWSNGISSTTPILDIFIDGPVRARADWRVYYWVSIETENPITVEKTGWIERGSHLIINATPIEREIENGVKTIFKGWTGSIISSNPIIEIPNLREPLIIKAIWVKKYLVVIETPKNSGVERERWILEDETYDILAPRILPLDNYTRMIFDKWIGCSIVQDDLCIINGVKSPMKVTAEYSIEKKVILQAISLNNEFIEGVDFVIKHKDGEVKKVSSSSQTWMRTGDWIIISSTWKGFDVKSMEELKIEENSPYSIRILVRVFKTSFKVTDYLGLPVEGARIIVKTEDGRLLYEGVTDNNGQLYNVGPFPSVNLIAIIIYQNNHIQREFDIKSSSPIFITIPLSWTSLQIIILTIMVTTSLVAVAVIRSLRRRRESSIMIPLPSEPSPSMERVDEDIEEEEIKKAPVVTLDEVIRKLEMSGEKVDEVLGELAEKLKKKDKRSGSS
ncbi:MAG: hypothetical protein ABDH32_02765 [Candidatus Caldarchaeales archaeon]